MILSSCSKSTARVHPVHAMNVETAQMADGNVRVGRWSIFWTLPDLAQGQYDGTQSSDF